MKLTFLLIVVLLAGCASINSKLTCNMGVLASPESISELNCYEASMKSKDPNFKLLSDVRAQLEARDARRFEHEVDSCELVKSTFQTPVGGVVRIPANISEEAANEKIRRFCLDQKLSGYKIIEVQSNKDFLGTRSRGGMSCGQFGCVGGGRSRAEYSYFQDMTFTCN